MPYVYLSGQNQERLDRIVKTGLFGADESDVLGWAVLALIQHAVRDDFIALDPPADDPAELDAAAPPEMAAPARATEFAQAWVDEARYILEPAPHAASPDDDMPF